jgi:hypothetical protein
LGLAAPLHESTAGAGPSLDEGAPAPRALSQPSPTTRRWPVADRPERLIPKRARRRRGGRGSRAPRGRRPRSR